MNGKSNRTSTKQVANYFIYIYIKINIELRDRVIFFFSAGFSFLSFLCFLFLLNRHILQSFCDNKTRKLIKNNENYAFRNLLLLLLLLFWDRGERFSEIIIKNIYRKEHTKYQINKKYSSYFEIRWSVYI
jgi:hypothetical protein